MAVSHSSVSFFRSLFCVSCAEQAAQPTKSRSLLGSSCHPFFNTQHREQVQAQVADLGQNPMQRGLVLDWAGDQGLAIPQAGQRQPLKPPTPVAVQQTADTNLVIVSSCCRHRNNVPAIAWIVSVKKEYSDEYCVELRGGS